MKKTLTLITLAALCACAPHYLPDEALGGRVLTCGGHKMTVLLFDGAAWMDKGAGFTTRMKQVVAASGAKYEEVDHKIEVLWNKGSDWTYYGPHKPGMECKVMKEYSRKQAQEMYDALPCIKGDCE
ncbi:MAG: MliC family protein [Rickettsiales bacterium]|jgi:hypothetical protein|nr:MliC family protein [Rickettsiales bacterium]